MGGALLSMDDRNFETRSCRYARVCQYLLVTGRAFCKVPDCCCCLYDSSNFVAFPQVEPVPGELYVWPRSATGALAANSAFAYTVRVTRVNVALQTADFELVNPEQQQPKPTGTTDCSWSEFSLPNLTFADVARWVKYCAHTLGDEVALAKSLFSNVGTWSSQQSGDISLHEDAPVDRDKVAAFVETIAQHMLRQVGYVQYCVVT